MERGALQAIILHPLRSLREDVFPVMVEAEYKRSIHLDAVIIEAMAVMLFSPSSRHFRDYLVAASLKPA
jgi:hypothetical protein